MRIAVFHELPYGGARRAVIEFSRQLGKKNTVDLYYIDEKKEKGIEDVFSNIKFIKFVPKKWTGKNWRAKLYKDTIELIKLYALHKKIASAIDEKEYNFVFIHGSKHTQAPFIIRHLKTNSVYYCQEPLRMVYEEMFRIPDSLSFGRKIYERINRNNRRIIDKSNAINANVLLANSKYTKNYIKKVFGVDSIVSYMGIDSKKFFPEKTKKKFDVLFIGSRDEIDGYELLKKSLKLIPGKINVRWLLREDEWISDDNVMRRIYNESKIIACFAYNEPFGLSPIEAQACGAVVLAVNEGGYRETVKENETGIFVRKNPTEIAKEISKLLNDKTMLEILSKNSIKNVKENWTWEINSNRLLKNIKSQLML